MCFAVGAKRQILVKTELFKKSYDIDTGAIAAPLIRMRFCIWAR